MALHKNSFLRKIPHSIPTRIVYHVLILLVNFVALFEFIDSTFGKRTTIQKFFYFTSWNQISIIIYYVWVLFYNISLYIKEGHTSKCPRTMLRYLKVNLSISAFVALSSFLMKTFSPSMIISKNKENLVQIPFSVDIWVHFFNFLFLCLDLVLERNRKFIQRKENLLHIFIVIFGIYSVALLSHNLIFGKNVYPFLKDLNLVLGSLLAVIVIGFLYLLDHFFTFILETLWTDSN